MTATRRILWGEGIFLRPQHFQQQELYLEGRLAQCLAAIHAHPWGVRTVRLDPVALAGGMLSCEELRLVFQDGTGYDAPREDPLPRARSLGEVPGLAAAPLVHACLPLLDPSGGNVGQGDPEDRRPVRFRLGQALVPDLHTEAVEADVTVLQPQVRLMLGGENRDGHCSVPIARLCRHGGSWRADPGYVAPALALEGAPPLLTLLDNLVEALQARSRTLAGTHRERNPGAAEYGTEDVASFWLLHTVNRSFPLLSHLLAHPRAHPEALYLGLAQLAGELLTFAPARSLGEIPPYRHEDLTGTFQGLEALIRGLLETVISARYAVIPLQEDRPSFHVGRLEGRLGQSDLYLSVGADLPLPELIQAVLLTFKLGSRDDVEKSLHSALPGVQLGPVAQAPAMLPVRIGHQYFALEPRGPIYERMVQTRSICVYVPQSLHALSFELIAVFR